MFGEEGARSNGADRGTDTPPQGGARAQPTLELEVGKGVGGTDWVLEGTLGRGGMAVVLAVVKPIAGIKGAMKVPHADLVAQGEVGARFLEEAKLYTSLKHPHIVGVIDCGLLDSGTPFMVMERLRGRTLRDVLGAAQVGRKGLRPSTAYEIISAVCDALHRLHSHRPVAVVHRDVKPENIFIHEVEGVAGRGTVKLLDLGLAGQVGLRRKVLMGTPRYMSPEQIRGENVSEHTDQYAVALVLYEMLSGRLPWDADVTDVEAMAQVHLKKAPLPLNRFCPWIPAGVGDAIAFALAKDPNKRLASILHFTDAIGQLEFVKDGQEQADLCITARTAPTLASLAAYDTSPDTSGAMPVSVEEDADLFVRTDPFAHAQSSSSDGGATDESSSLVAGLEEGREERAVQRASIEPNRVSVPNAADGKTNDAPIESSGAKEEARVGTPAPLPANMARMRNRRPLSRRIAAGSLGLGFCLGLAVALVAIGLRSFGGPPRRAPTRANDSSAAQAAAEPPPQVMAKPPTLPTLLWVGEPVPVVSPAATAPSSAPSASAARLTAPPSSKSARAGEHVLRASAKRNNAPPAAVDDGREFFETH